MARLSLSLLLLVLLTLSGAAAFVPAYDAGARQYQAALLVLRSHDHDEASPDLNRRLAFTSSAALVTLLLPAQSALAASGSVFKGNPLTNPVFEQIRILDQEYADNVKYGGELEKGNAGNKGKVDAYPKLLVPLVEISKDLSKVNQLVKSRDTWPEAKNIMNNSARYDKKEFKKIFNAYGDNIYYSDPDRANLYLGGGATPRNEQSMAYLLRNDVLTNIEYLQAELEYLTKQETEEAEKENPIDLLQYAETADKAMTKYMALVPPQELKSAMEMMNSKSSK